MELAYIVGWLIIAVACFFLVALVFDRYGSHSIVQQTMLQTNPDEDNLPPDSTLPHAKPYADKERSKFIEALPLGDLPPFIGMDADGNSLPEKPVKEPLRETGIKEIYPERLAELRRHKGFRSAAFENFWRETHKEERYG